MAALTSAAFAVSNLKTEIIGRKRRSTGTLTLTGGSDTYPTTGIPLPAIANFGFVRNMDALHVDAGLPTETSGYLARWTGASDHALQLFEEEASAAGGPLPECDTSEAPGTRVWYFEAWGW